MVLGLAKCARIVVVTLKETFKVNDMNPIVQMRGYCEIGVLLSAVKDVLDSPS